MKEDTEEQLFDSNSISKICKPMSKISPWMNFIAIVLILIGITLIFTIYGIFIAWIPIWMGVLLVQSASLYKTAQFQNNKDVTIAAAKKLSLFFTISGIVFLVGFVFAIATIIMILAGATSVGGIFNVLENIAKSLF